MTERQDLLFVYGTLRAGGGRPLARWFPGRVVRLGPGRVAGALLDLGGYPGLVEDVPGTVRGEVYRLQAPRQILAALDAYEGCAPHSPHPHEYERVRRAVTLDDGRRVTAWVYLYRGPRRGRWRIPSGDWLARRKG